MPGPYLHLAEVEVFGWSPAGSVPNKKYLERKANLKNVAIGGIATQSSVSHGGIPSRAIDGNVSGIWGHASTTHTTAANAWWMVDLKNTYDIDSITLWNRLDCCTERLSNFKIQVIDSDNKVSVELGPFKTNRNRKINFDDIRTRG